MSKPLFLMPDESIHYAYSQLSGKRRQAYERLCSALAAGKRQVPVRGLDRNEAFEVLKMVRADHPEVYWCSSGISMGVTVGQVTFYLERDASCRPDDDEHLLAAADAFASNLPASADQYTVAREAFRLIASKTSYDTGAADGEVWRQGNVRPYEATGALLDGHAVCSGFAKATQMLLQRAGIMAYCVPGEARSPRQVDDQWEGHAWLLVRIDGQFYHMDPTWASMEGRDGSLAPGQAFFEYFCLTDREVAPSHRVREGAPLPPCTATTADYFRREGLCLRAWDSSRYADMVVRQLATGAEGATVKAANQTTYERMIDQVTKCNGWANVVRRAATMTCRNLDTRRIKFVSNPTLRTLTLFVSEEGA